MVVFLFKYFEIRFLSVELKLIEEHSLVFSRFGSIKNYCTEKLEKNYCNLTTKFDVTPNGKLQTYTGI